jgi:hypothetical protein
VSTGAASVNKVVLTPLRGVRWRVVYTMPVLSSRFVDIDPLEKA